MVSSALLAEEVFQSTPRVRGRQSQIIHVRQLIYQQLQRSDLFIA